METMHPEGGDSLFLAKDNASIAAVVSDGDEDEDPSFANCPMDGCGEVILLTELDSHIEMHGVEDQDVDEEFMPISREQQIAEVAHTSFENKLSHGIRNLKDQGSSSEGSSSDGQRSAKAAWKSILKMPDTSAKPPPSSTTKGSRRRLGVSICYIFVLYSIRANVVQKSELGPHANENQMPHWLVKVLESDGEIKSINRLGPDGKLRKVKVAVNHAAGMLPVIAQLLVQDRSTQVAYLCHPSVRHVSKLRREGKQYTSQGSRYLANRLEVASAAIEIFKC